MTCTSVVLFCQHDHHFHIFFYTTISANSLRRIPELRCIPVLFNTLTSLDRLRSIPAHRCLNVFFNPLALLDRLRSIPAQPQASLVLWEPGMHEWHGLLESSADLVAHSETVSASCARKKQPSFNLTSDIMWLLLWSQRCLIPITGLPSKLLSPLV